MGILGLIKALVDLINAVLQRELDNKNAGTKQKAEALYTSADNNPADFFDDGLFNNSTSPDPSASDTVPKTNPDRKP